MMYLQFGGTAKGGKKYKRKDGHADGAGTEAPAAGGVKAPVKKEAAPVKAAVTCVDDDDDIFGDVVGRFRLTLSNPR